MFLARARWFCAWCDRAAYEGSKYAGFTVACFAVAALLGQRQEPGVVVNFPENLGTKMTSASVSYPASSY